MTRETIRAGKIPDVIWLRERVSRFLVVLLWLHAPLVIAMAVHNGTNVVAQSLIVGDRLLLRQR
jgi:hypothetical protein